MTTFVVERYWPGVTVDMAEALMEREASLAAAMTAEGRAVQVLHATLLEGDETIVSVVEAPSRADVAELGERSGTPGDRITAAVPMRSPAVGSTAGEATR